MIESTSHTPVPEHHGDASPASVVTAATGAIGWGGAAAARAAGFGLGWVRVADALAEAMPASEVTRIWLFPPVRREDREWGTAVVARRVGDGRVRVYTARYVLVLRGRERGQGRVAIDDVGESPDQIVPDVIRGVQDRVGESEPPTEIAPDLWYRQDDEPAATG